MPDDMRELWQTQPVERVAISADQIRTLSRQWERRIRWRNAREYLGGGVAALFFAMNLWRSHGWHRLPPALLIAGVIFVLWEVHRRGAARPAPQGAGVLESIVFHRRELERQRDALRSVWSWYLLPILPGLAAQWLEAARGFGVVWVAMLVAVGTVIYVIWDANRRAADRIDREVQEWKAMEEDNE